MNYLLPADPTPEQAERQRDIQAAVGVVESLLYDLPDSPAKERATERLFEAACYACHAVLVEKRPDDV